MLNRLRVQFVCAATAALLLALVLVMAPVYLLISNAFSAQIETILDVLLENDGDMPQRQVTMDGGRFILIPQEQQYETRYFSVMLDAEGNPLMVNTKAVYSIDDPEALEIAQSIYPVGRRISGRIAYDGGVYLYKVGKQAHGMLLVFADCTSRYWIIHQAMVYMLMVGLVILLVFSLTLVTLSKRIVEPFIENSERQKRFITNASHELKTPLSVISANTEMQEIETGKSKWTESTMRQVKRLNALVSELVTLTKLDEQDDPVLSDVDASAIAKEQADNFEQVILQQGKAFGAQIEEGVHIQAEARSVQELCSIFLDNAAKYCDDGGMVKIKLSARGKGATLSVSNSYAAGKGVDYHRFFDRFYREDESHNSKKSGFGIGLSIAQEIARRLGAKLQVGYHAGVITFTVLFR